MLLASGVPLPLSVSAGIAHVSDPGGTTRDLYALADAALYRAKHGGRGQVAESVDSRCDDRRALSA
jgi:GGDEF domain-containing protein